ncbi:TetR/AcrR family transcriptional regulator [Microlunatus parietis]|uniref:TetR/AcrR family transcriptional repressor of mexJK operon n=1 Tax=Microlunatus parietis TaxID=682979 RepID=A0A7Y9LEC3_9ACTN|nr:TetR/AcrR family transcriptional regulator [Microlunatus parietis]NYE72901.1 TetR/AcrR family transcriptional repressor of mexJK operon [Microlunatus parietis]
MSGANGPSGAKHDAILRAAKEAFLRDGFAAGNVDDIAAQANVSKVTIYSHFGSKEDLFRRVMEWVIASRSAGGPALDPGIDPSELHAVLTAIGLDLVRTVRSKEVLAMRRVLIAEQARHPSLAEAWRRATTLATTESLKDYFVALQRRGMIMDDADPRTMASQFLWMLIGDSLDAGLLGGSPRPRGAQGVAEAAATTIVRAYSADETQARRSHRRATSA